jgi:hypothetical protein
MAPKGVRLCEGMEALKGEPHERYWYSRLEGVEGVNRQEGEKP